jgi:ubiquinol-cytochrome c reductase cytochrome c subunit
MRYFSLTFLILAGTWILPCPMRAQIMAQASKGNPENGKRLYVKNGCYQCHGFVGQGGGAGPRLAPRPIALAALIAYVRHPAPGDMPVFSSKVMSDAELTDVWAFLKAIPESPAAKSIPLLSE